MRIVRSLGRAIACQWMGALALFLVLSTGTAYAASSMWTGANIVDGSLTGADVQDGSLSGTDIQSGSITSSDLAPDATSSSGSAPLVQWDPTDTPDIPASSTGLVALGSQAFNLPESGFVDLRFTGSVTGDAGVCSANGYYVTVTAEVDGDTHFAGDAFAEDDGDGYPAYGGHSQTPQVSYLAAGEHTLTLVGQVYRCGSPSGSFHVSDVHALMTAP